MTYCAWLMPLVLLIMLKCPWCGIGLVHPPGCASPTPCWPYWGGEPYPRSPRWPGGGVAYPGRAGAKPGDASPPSPYLAPAPPYWLMCGSTLFVALWRLIVFFSELDRPTKKNRAAHKATKATPPTAMPAMAPVDSLWLPLFPLLAGVDVADDVASAGIGSPGAIWKSAAAAACTCDANVCVELGLITPTICSPIQLFGAAQ